MKQFFRFSILVLALLLPATATAHDFEVDGIYYNINGNEATVTFKGLYDSSYDNEYSGSVVIPATVTYNGTTYPVTSISYCAFAHCTGLTSITIPNSVTTINMETFWGCTGLTSITIPNSVTSIGRSAFWECTGLTSITIPNSVTSIGDGAFQDCSRLASIDIPNSVTEIGINAFYGCTALTSIDIPNSVTSLGYGVFYNCPGLTSIVVESGNPRYDSRNNCNAIIETASNTLIYGCKNTTIPNSVTAIDNYVFSGCTGLTSIDIPNSVTAIGDWAFQNCTGLTSITMGNSVTSIGAWAFDKCNALTSVDIPNSVTVIGDGAFQDCSGLTSLVIPNSVTSIGEKAFYACSGLTSVTIPNSVTYVGGKAFYNCSGLTDVYCYIANPLRVSLAGDAFDLYDGDVSGRTLHVLPGTTEAYYYYDWYWYFEQVIEDLIPEPEPLPGDVNGDREVNIADVNAVINIILSGNDDNTAADVNGDGEINIADVNAIINIILNLVVEEEHEWVDLGLPSGTLWATCNVGASNPEELGSYFAWGETATKDFYDWSTYKWCNNNYMKMTKYCTVSNYGNDGFVDNKTELDLEDDAAYVNWGPSWRIPSYEQFEELYTSCTSLWTQHNGVNGLMFTGPNGNHLFLPATGMRWGDGLGGVGADGYYWSRTLYNYPNDAFILIFKSNVLSYWDCSYRSIGLTVRAVRASN